MPAAALADGEVNLYTTREPGLIQPLIDVFTKETGITVNTVFVKDGLPERVAAEGANSPVDVLMTVDIGGLVDLVDKGVTQPIESAALDAAVPENLRDPNGHWFTLSMRARVLYVDEGRSASTSFTYEQLADPAWKGKVCIRSGQHPYNVALIAAYIAHHGEAATKTWLEGVKANVARQPGGGDRDVARDILGGICEIGPANSYYVGLMRSGAGGPEQDEWGNAIDVVIPTFDDGGTHVNVSGAAVAKNAPEQGQRGQVPRIPRLGRGAGALRQGEFRVPGEGRRDGRSDHRRPRRAQSRQPRARRDRAEPQGREPARRRSRLRQLAMAMSRPRIG